MSALERIVADHGPQLGLGQVFFCAPDEDVRTFKGKATRFAHQPENRTLPVSPQDKAVFLSFEKTWTAGPRGIRSDKRPITTLDGVDTIEVGGFGAFSLGHGYFASA